MPHPQIKFGTDGWRGLIADDFTFANVRIAAEAIAAYMHAKEDPAKGLCIGYDTRFGSKAFARACAEVAAATGIPVHAGQRHHAHPGAELRRARARRRRRHHDHLFAQSGAVERRQVQGLVRRLRQALHHRRNRVLPRPARARASAARAPSTEVDFLPTYLKAIENFADLDLIAKSGMKFCIDSMYGAGGTIISDIFNRIGVAHVQIRCNPDPLFPGINPEPIEPHIRALGEAAVANGCQAGLCTDGDADRIGATDEHGNFVDPHKIYSVLLSWVLAARAGPAPSPAPSTPPRCSTASAPSTAASSSNTASASSLSATTCSSAKS